MIEGHGDDTHHCGPLCCNFSSNISPLIDTTPLRRHLSTRLDLIGSYPEPSPRSLEARIAASLGICSTEVLVTNGATDAIYLIAQALRHERTFAVCRPSFSEYADACRMFGYEEQPHDAAVRWLCNPNNPTGEVKPADSVRELAQRHRWLVVDHSYQDYTLQPLLSDRDAISMGNVVVVHSMTKCYAIPGLRLGYIAAPQPVIGLLRQNSRPWAVNALAIEAGHWLLQHPSPDYRRLMERLLAETARLSGRLNMIPGLSVSPTSTNFMLCALRDGSAASLKDYLLSRHRLLIRDASNFEGLGPAHFRISTQLPAYNDMLADAIYEWHQDLRLIKT